jgi:hypothetical protein
MEEALQAIAARYGAKVTCVYNPFYAVADNLGQLLAGPQRNDGRLHPGERRQRVPQRPRGTSPRRAEGPRQRRHQCEVKFTMPTT